MNCLAALKVYNSLNALEYFDPFNCCRSVGISCDKNGLIDFISLPNKNLQGTIDPAIGDIFLLQKLDLRNNRISGPLPASLGRLPILTSLRVSGNQLSGSIPSTFSSLQLQECSLGGLCRTSALSPACGSVNVCGAMTNNPPVVTSQPTQPSQTQSPTTIFVPTESRVIIENTFTAIVDNPVTSVVTVSNGADPTVVPPSNPSTNDNQSSSTQLSPTSLVTIALGSLLFLALVAFLFVRYRRMRQKREERFSEMPPLDDYQDNIPSYPMAVLQKEARRNSTRSSDPPSPVDWNFEEPQVPQPGSPYPQRGLQYQSMTVLPKNGETVLSLEDFYERLSKKLDASSVELVKIVFRHKKVTLLLLTKLNHKHLEEFGINDSYVRFCILHVLGRE
ncbi:hypothetical protein EDD86DRAFT_200588 [Gorgonomyces haynaldii]|nr:hypothetical protein EDD86DRAFT_200588 [Gorgonomyces haynaldii]